METEHERINAISQQIRDAQRKPDIELMWRLVAELQAMGSERALAEATAASGLASSLSGHHADAVEYFSVALDQYTRLRSDSKVAKVLTMMALEQAEIGQIPAAFASFTRALELCTTPDLARLKAVATGDTGILYMRMGDYPSALEHYDRAIALYEAADDRFSTGNVLGNIGNVYFVNGEYAKAIEYHQRSIAVYEEFSDVRGLARASMNVGIAQAMSGDHASARVNMERALESNRQLGYEMGVQAVMLNLAELLLRTDEMDEAEKLLSELTSMYIESSQHRCAIHALRAQIHESRGELTEAVAELTTAQQIAADAGHKRDLANLHRALRDIALAQQDLAAYVQHNDAFQQLTEEIQGKETTQRMAMLEASKQMEAERQERARERAILYSTLPQHIADRVIRGETIEDHFEHAAVLFADIVGFTTHTSSMHPSETIKLLEDIYKTFDAICAEHGVTKVKTIGDSYLCFAGSDIGERISDIGERISDIGPAERIAAVALAMQNAEFYWPTSVPEGSLEDSLERLALRIGVHSGPLTAGVIGTQRLQYDIWGDTVNVASRMESTGEPGRIQCSESFARALCLVPSASEEGNRAPGTWHQALVERGSIEIKGKGPMTTYWLE